MEMGVQASPMVILLRLNAAAFCEFEKRVDLNPGMLFANGMVALALPCKSKLVHLEQALLESAIDTDLEKPRSIRHRHRAALILGRVKLSIASATQKRLAFDQLPEGLVGTYAWLRHPATAYRHRNLSALH